MKEQRKLGIRRKNSALMTAVITRWWGRIEARSGDRRALTRGAQFEYSKRAAKNDQKNDSANYQVGVPRIGYQDQ